MVFMTDEDLERALKHRFIVGTCNKKTDYDERSAVRVIVINQRNQVALLHSAGGGYCKLPGGGIEDGETHYEACEREAAEAIGCRITLEPSCIGVVDEFRDNLHQISYCCVAKMTEDLGYTHLTDAEVADGLQNEWMKILTALHALGFRGSMAAVGKYIQARDFCLLEAYANSKGMECKWKREPCEKVKVLGR